MAAKEPSDGAPYAREAALAPAFDPSSMEGRRLYETFTDEELLGLLRAMARRLGHSPSQKEVPQACRALVRERFGKWPYALSRAGLSRSAGKGGERVPVQCVHTAQAEALLSAVRSKAKELGRTPHPGDLPQVCAALKKRYTTWGQVLQAAGLERIREETVRQIHDLEPEYRAMLEGLRAMALSLGRAPRRQEAPEEVRARLAARCGSWRNVLYQIGLEPVQRISPFSTAYLDRPPGTPRGRHRGTLHDCYYRVLNLDQETKAQLEELKAQSERLGRPPDRRDVSPGLRRHLQEACGSWRNALFQIGLHNAAKPVKNETQ